MLLPLLIFIIFYALFGCICLMYRNEKVCAVKKRMVEHIKCLSQKEININLLDHWENYYLLYEKNYSYDKLLFDIRINLDKFEKDFTNKTNKIHLEVIKNDGSKL